MDPVVKEVELGVPVLGDLGECHADLMMRLGIRAGVADPALIACDRRGRGIGRDIAFGGIGGAQDAGDPDGNGEAVVQVMRIGQEPAQIVRVPVFGADAIVGPIQLVGRTHPCGSDRHKRGTRLRDPGFGAVIAQPGGESGLLGQGALDLDEDSEVGVHHVGPEIRVGDIDRC